MFSAVAWIGAALTYWTPETTYMKMPETLGEAEHLAPERSMLAVSQQGVPLIREIVS